MNKTQKQNLTRLENRLCNMGISLMDVRHLLRIERALRRWHELECGTDRGAIERDEKTGRPWMRREVANRTSGTHVVKWIVRDMEKANLKALDGLMKSYPDLVKYVQTDPRGCALYILRKIDVSGADISSVYTRGVAVCI